MHYIISLYVFGISRMLHDVTSSSPQAPKKLMKLLINSPQAQKISILIHFHCFPELESSWPGNYMKTCISLKCFGNFTMHYLFTRKCSITSSITGAPKSPQANILHFPSSSAKGSGCDSSPSLLPPRVPAPLALLSSKTKKNQSDLRPLAS